jgi:hypothetical protein
MDFAAEDIDQAAVFEEQFGRQFAAGDGQFMAHVSHDNRGTLQHPPPEQNKMCKALALATQLSRRLHCKRMRKIGLAAALALLGAWPLQGQPNGVTAQLQLAQEQYLPGEDLQLKVRITNRSGQEIFLGADNDWLVLSITGEHNALCPKLGEMPLQGAFSLLSGEVGTRPLNPTPFFDFRRPGRYRIAARIRLPQWRQEIVCKSVSFTVANGVPLPNLANLQFGMPPAPGAATAAPEVRSYSLLKASFLKELKLYFRLTDGTGKILRVFPVARMTSFTVPEAQMDRFNNLHVLSQTGARTFNYCEINPEGQWVLRQTHLYNGTRPVLRVDAEGRIFVAGGARRLSADDFPPAAPEPANPR